MRILLVDDHEIVLEALQSRFSKHPAFEVVGLALTGEAAVEQAARHRPELVLMDLRMPGLGGLETIRRLKASWPTLQIVVLTVSDREEDLIESILAGASGYILKESRPELLLDAIQALQSGSSLLPGNLLREALRRLASGLVTVSSPPAPLDEPLTERQFQILQLITKGHTTQSLQRELKVTEATVKKHVHAIIAKLGVSDRTQAVIKAIRLGIVEP